MLLKKASMTGRRTMGIFGILFLSVIILSCGDDPENRAKGRLLELYFEEHIHDYGVIEEDSDGNWSFEFKNIGHQAIVINRVRSTCGCTVPRWPGEPVEPGDTGKITVIYNTATTGTFLKSVFVYSSAANSPVKLQIKGKVVPAG
jgi:hypothetical protein